MSEPQEPKHSLTIVGVYVDAFKRIRVARVTPTPTGLIQVRGRNAQGKSSFIEAMKATLKGASGKIELPILEGQHGAEVVVDLGDLVVRRRWKRGSDGKAKTSVTVEDADGREKRSPQAVLDSLMAHMADPVAFMGLKPAEQVKMVLAILGVDVELAGLEETEQEAMDERTHLGRDLKRLEGAFAELDAELSGIPVPKAAGTVQELTAQLQVAKDQNAAKDAAGAAAEAAKARGVEAAARLVRLREETDKLEAEISEQRNAYTAAAEIFNTTDVVDVTPLVDALAAHEDNSRHLGRLELLEAKRIDYGDAQCAHEAGEAAVAEARVAIAQLLGAAQFPVDGMAYDHVAKSLTLNGIPLAQLSQGEQVRVSAAVAMSGDPVIRVLFVREGSLLDDVSLMQLAEHAERAKFQVFCEIVDSTREGSGLWVESGEVFEAEPAASGTPEASA